MSNSKVLHKLCWLHDWTCYYCHCEVRFTEPRTASSPTVDHKIPRGRGGRHAQFNLVLACYSCNHKKGDMTEEEFEVFNRCLDSGMSKRMALKYVQNEFDIPPLYGGNK